MCVFLFDLLPIPFSSIGKQLFLWGGVDTDSSAKCLDGLYVYHTGTVFLVVLVTVMDF